MSFVHLHLHSEYSLLDGACRIADIPKAAKAAGHSAAAITDHGVMYGVVDFYKACIDQGIKPIIGCEVYVAARTRFDKTHEYDAHSNHLVLLCKNETGYRNLIYMASQAFIEGFYSKPRVDFDLLSEHSDGLIALSACLAGSIPRAITAGDHTQAQRLVEKFIGIFGRDNFFLELQNHGVPEQRTVNAALVKLAEKNGVGLVATNDVHYIKKSDADNQAILLCVQTNSVITNGRPIGFETDEYYYKSTGEMTALFPPESYPGAIENTQRIADMCDFKFEFGKLHLPRYKPDNGQKPEDFLRSLTYAGLDNRIERGHLIYGADNPESKYRERIEYELSVVIKMGYAEYYLIVWDFINYSKSKGIPVGPGRGSGAGSLVAYLVGITDIDPIRFDLLFERFLNPERISMPDFDIDFCYDRRDEAIEYVRQKYGADHTSQIITFGTLAARAAVRDVGRALGMTYGDVDSIAKLIPQHLNVTLKGALESVKELKDEYDTDDTVRRLIDTAMALEGMPRNASTHAAGVVITEKPVADYVPLSVNNDVTVTQFDMETVAELGLLKFDFLALRYLTIISDAERQIKSSAPDFDMSKIPMDDAASYKLICDGQTDGVFQLESAGMRQMLMQLLPQSIDDIIAAIALYRPGPMDSIPRYLECRRDHSKIKYRTPLLAPILDVTHGCIIYQEQVMQIFREIAGYSLGRADIVRRAMSKKKASVLERERTDFINGAAERGVDREDAEGLFDDMASFASYAFNKSHAAAYAVISYRTAYLKAHYPVEYIAALLTSVLGVTVKIAQYISECQRSGIAVKPPSINESGVYFKADAKTRSIRFGLLALKNVGKTFIINVVAEREAGGKYTSFENFLDRVKNFDVNRRQVETLIKAGAFDGLGTKRSQLAATYEKLMDIRLNDRRNNVEGQLDLFAASSVGSASPPFKYPDIPEFSARDLLMLEKESSGLYFSGHILDGYTETLKRLRPDLIAEIIGDTATDDDSDEAGQSPPIGKYGDKDRVTIAGIITKRTNKATKSNDQMAFVTLEDRTADMEVVVFPKVLAACSNALNYDDVSAITGTIQLREDEAPKLIAQRAVLLAANGKTQKKPQPAAETPVQQQPVKQASRVVIRVPSADENTTRRIFAIAEIFAGSSELLLYASDKSEYMRSSVKIAPTPYVVRLLCELFGENNVKVI